jgi:hypothetical protein
LMMITIKKKLVNKKFACNDNIIEHPEYK